MLRALYAPACDSLRAKPGKNGRKTAAVRFHVSFDPIGLHPGSCALTPAKVDEKQQWQAIRANRPDANSANVTSVEVGDRNFGSNYRLLSELTGGGVNFVVRIKQSAKVEILEEIAVTEAQRAADIERHAWVRLGISNASRSHHRVRLIWLKRPDKTIVLATNLEVADAPAAIVAGMYALFASKSSGGSQCDTFVTSVIFVICSRFPISRPHPA